MKCFYLLIFLLYGTFTFSQQNSAYFKVRSQLKPPSDLLNDTRENRFNIYINDDSIIKQPYVVDWVYHKYKDDTIVNYIVNRNELREIKPKALTSYKAFFSDTIDDKNFRLFLGKTIIDSTDTLYNKHWFHGPLNEYHLDVAREFKINTIELSYGDSIYIVKLNIWDLIRPNINNLYYGYRPIEVYVDGYFIHIYVMGGAVFSHKYLDEYEFREKNTYNFKLTSFENYYKYCNNGYLSKDSYLTKFVFDVRTGYIGKISINGLGYFNVFCEDFIGF